MGRTAGKTAIESGMWMSLVEAARTLAETRQTVLTRVVKGEIKALHVAGRTVVDRASVEKILKDRGRPVSKTLISTR